jgi:hypothetical protein
MILSKRIFNYRLTPLLISGFLLECKHSAGRGREWWLERVVEQAACRLSVAEFWRQQRLSTPSFYGWLRTLLAE